MRVQINMTGKTPLLMHNERLADQDDEITKQIKEITAKGKDQTDKDKETVSLLEFRGGLYLDAKGEICMPSINVLRCLRDTATATKSGKKISGGLTPFDLNVPIDIGGPTHVDKLIKNPIHFDRRMVKVSGRVKRTRPIFPKWSLSIEFEMLEDILNFSALVNIVEMAGRSTGLGDARKIGYGRFQGEVKKLK